MGGAGKWRERGDMFCACTGRVGRERGLGGSQLAGGLAAGRRVGWGGEDGERELIDGYIGT